MVTTIQIDGRTKILLDRLKVHHRETYNELLRRLVKAYQSNTGKEELVETLEILSSPETMHEIAEALEDYELKKGKSLKQLRKELGA